MTSYIVVVCALLFAQNALAQVQSLLGGSKLGNTATGNAVVSNNVGINNMAGLSAANLGGFSASNLAGFSNLANSAGNLASSGSNLASGSSNLASTIGNSVISSVGSNLASNIVNNFGGASSVIGNSAVSNNVGVNLAGSNLAGSSLAGSNLAVGSTASNLKGSFIPLNSFSGNAANNVGSSGGLSLGALTNVKFGEVELFKDLPANNGYSGEYPVIGYVTFEGYIPASGTVTVANDGCGCTK